MTRGPRGESVIRMTDNPHAVDRKQPSLDDAPCNFLCQFSALHPRADSGEGLRPVVG